VLDDLIGELVGHAIGSRLSESRRTQLLLRLFFGLLGTGLGIAGAVHFASRTGLTQNAALRLSIVAVFLFVASFSLFNVALGRTWRWPAKLFIVSFVAMFVARIAFGR
jgi:hypothetical protein